MHAILHKLQTQEPFRPGRSGSCATSESFFLLRPDVRHVFRKRVLVVFAERPGGLEMVVVDKRVHRVMHVPVIGALQVRDAHQIKRDRLRLRRIRSAHRRLISRHAIVRQFYLVAIEVIQGGHLHRLAILYHAELLQYRRPSGGQLQVQCRLVHVRLIGFPVANQRFEFFKRLRTASTCGGGCDCHRAQRQQENTNGFYDSSHGLSSSLKIFGTRLSDHSKSELYCVATADAAVFPNRCVANPTIAPSNIPGSKMSQNNAIPARRITSRLSAAAIPIPARIPTSIEWMRCETYPVATPPTNPFSNENVITLPITGASDGSKNPLNPSRSPSAPPTASPSIGFVRLIISSCENDCACVMHSLGILVGLHHPEEVSLGVCEVREVSDCWNRRLRHDQLPAGFGHRFHGGVDGIHADGVGRRLDFRILHEAAIDSWCSFRTGSGQPIVHRPPPSLNLPPEHFLVEG